jgi:hypothetical protein
MTEDTGPLALIVARRKEVESKIADITSRLEKLKAEHAELVVSERVIARLSPQPITARNGEPDASSEIVPTAKPLNTPTIADMILRSIADATAAGQREIRPAAMLEYIRANWWPNAPSSAIGPVVWRMAQRGKLVKQGEFYSLPPEQVGGAQSYLIPPNSA